LRYFVDVLIFFVKLDVLVGRLGNRTVNDADVAGNLVSLHEVAMHDGRRVGFQGCLHHNLMNITAKV
jgi:hypothetical protein